jgi:hypothetical protein
VSCRRHGPLLGVSAAGRTRLPLVKLALLAS